MQFVKAIDRNLVNLFFEWSVFSNPRKALSHSLTKTILDEHWSTLINAPGGTGGINLYLSFLRASATI